MRRSDETLRYCSDIKPRYNNYVITLFVYEAVRLAGWGDVPSQGRVEVFYDGIWGPVCGHHWDLQDARVVCRQLGFKGALGAAMESASVNVSRWFINVTCVGSETSITKCDHSGWSYYCSWSESRYIAFVVCTTGS